MERVEELGAMALRGADDREVRLGELVVAPGGKVKLVHRAAEVSDNVPVDALLEALR